MVDGISCYLETFDAFEAKVDDDSDGVGLNNDDGGEPLDEILGDELTTPCGCSLALGLD